MNDVHGMRMHTDEDFEPTESFADVQLQSAPTGRHAEQQVQLQQDNNILDEWDSDDGEGGNTSSNHNRSRHDEGKSAGKPKRTPGRGDRGDRGAAEGKHADGEPTGKWAGHTGAVKPDENWLDDEWD